MALNIAVPLSGLGDLSPISPIRIDCWENIKILVSPIGSESSGVSSLDSEEAKQQAKPTPPRKPEAVKQDVRIIYNGRDVLDLYKNVETNSTSWKFQYSHLPERNNISMFWANRSLYNRLGPNGLTPVYTINKCECCDFQYTTDCPNSYLSDTSLNMSSTTTSPMIFTTASNKKPEYQATKVTTVSNQLAANVTSAFNDQPLADYTNFELSNKQFSNQNNMNKTKFNDIYIKKSNILTNTNANYINKFNNINGGINKTASELSRLASALVAANASNSPSNTANENLMMGYSNNAIHQLNEPLTNNTKSNVAQSFLNSPFALSNQTNSNNNFPSNHITSSNNNISLNQQNTNNKTQLTSSNNFYSLFNSSNNTNNSAMYAFNSTNNNSNNNYINSFNSMSTSNNNVNSNPLTATSQHYGRMYKYF